jgi:ankyrin repeat domain-containing protein 17
MATKQEILQFQEMLFQRVQHTQGQAVVGQDYRYYGYHNEDDFDDGGEGDDEDDGEDDMDQQDPCFRGHDRLYPPPRTLRSLGASIPVDAQTDSNHDTALTLAAQGGYDKLVQLLLSHSADIEHKDKKGCTPLILAASAGHVVTVTVLLEHGANIEAVSDRTKDTALSLACSGGRQEVVDLLLQKKANFEHRNVSDYTPLSLAASGGYVSIMKALLRMGADVNSRTGSKLGITPLMLASMNGHTQAVKLLLDHGADINAQIETNKNTALTLACFQGRQEVVSLLCMRGGNVEHRAKTGLTPLMEAASGGYHEVGRVLVEHGADLNAPPVPSSKDTALTIAADKGHVKFVDMILKYGANVDVKNKKGNSPLWLACNGGHFEVVRCLLKAKSDPDSQDNRKVSCLTAAFRKGHVKVVKCLVDYVSQFPSDGDCRRFVSTITDKDHMKRSIQCLELISQAKERQEAEANKNASILLQELDMEKQNEEQKKMAAAKKRERKKRQKEKKKAKASEDVGKQEDNQDDDLTQECPPSSDALHLLPSSQLISAVTTTLTTTVAMVTTAVPLTATAVTTPSNKKTLATTNVTKTTRNVNISPKTIVLETTPTVSVTMATTRVKQPVKTTIVTTATIAVTTVVTSNSIASTTSPRKSRKEDTPVSTAGWREVHKKAKTTPRRSQSLRKEIAAKDMSSRESFLQDSMPRDVHHHPVDTYRDVMRERITTRVPLTPTTATSSTKTKPVSYQATAIKTSASLSSKGERSTKGKIPTSITESATQQVAKATVASYDNTFVSVSKDHAPLQTRPQLSKGAKVTSVDKTVAMATRSTSGTTVSVKSSVLGKGASPPKTVASMPTPAVTSVTMTTKHPISSVSKQPSGSVLPKMGMVTSSKKTQSSTRTSQSLASKGVSYSAIVGGAKVKEDLSSPPLNILSIATNTSDGTYQPFGPVVDSSSDHKPVPTPPGSGSPWRAPTAAKTSPSSKPAVTTPDDKQTTPKLSPSNNTGSNLSITIDTEVSGRHLGPIGPPSYNEKSPPTPLNDRSSLTHSPHTADEPQSPLTPSDYVVRETPSTTSSLPLLPTPIGPPTGPPTAPPAALPTILRPSEFPLKSPMVPGMPVGGAHPAYQPTRGPRPPLLPHPIFSQNQQPMAYYPMVEPHMVYGPEVTSPFGSSGEPPKGAILEGVGIVRNMGSGFNPNATPFIPSYLHGMSPTPHTNVMGMSPTPHTNVMGVAPEVIQPQRPYPVQMMYQHQYNLPQDGVLKVAGPPGPPAPGPPAPGPPTPGPPTAGPPAPGPTGPVQGGEGDWGKMHHQRVIPVHQSVVQNPQGPTPHLHSTAVTIVTPQPVPSPQIGYPIMLPGQQMQPEVSITMTTTSAASMKILDHLPPIGTERAHKRSSSYGNPIQFSTALYGKEDVWSFSEASSSTPFVWGTTSASVTMATTSESTIITTSEDHSDSFHDNSSSSKFVITSADTIDSVLTRLSLSDHLPVFKSNEIDLNALLLMTDKDYSELGIKEVPRLKLLTAIGNQSHNTSEDNPVRSEEAWLEETQVSASASNSQ